MCYKFSHWIIFFVFLFWEERGGRGADRKGLWINNFLWKYVRVQIFNSIGLLAPRNCMIQVNIDNFINVNYFSKSQHITGDSSCYKFNYRRLQIAFQISIRFIILF